MRFINFSIYFFFFSNIYFNLEFPKNTMHSCSCSVYIIPNINKSLSSPFSFLWRKLLTPELNCITNQIISFVFLKRTSQVCKINSFKENFLLRKPALFLSSTELEEDVTWLELHFLHYIRTSALILLTSFVM